MTLTHITIGQAGLHAESSEELAAAVQQLTAAGYQITDIEDDPAEPWHVATVHYQGGPAQLRTMKALLAS
jgi:hypothetical protein